MPIFERAKEQFWKHTELGFDVPFKTITGGHLRGRFSDIIQQMCAAFMMEREGALGGRFGCATPAEAVQSHRIFAASLRALTCKAGSASMDLAHERYCHRRVGPAEGHRSHRHGATDESAGRRLPLYRVGLLPCRVIRISADYVKEGDANSVFRVMVRPERDYLQLREGLRGALKKGIGVFVYAKRCLHAGSAPLGKIKF